MKTPITGSDLPEPEGKQPCARAMQPGIAVVLPAVPLLGGLPRAARRLFDRVGIGLQRFDDNLWDGGDT